MKGSDVMEKKYEVRAFGVEEIIAANSAKEAACIIARKHGYTSVNRKYTNIGYGIEIDVQRYDAANHNRVYFYSVKD